MANPVITSTTTRWADATHISANMVFANGTGTITVFEGATQKASVTTTSGATKSITFSGISKNNTYRIRYLVTGTNTATKWDELIGATPVISTHPNGGVTFGAKAASGEFRVKYPSYFDQNVKINAGLWSALGIDGPIVGNGTSTPPNAIRGTLMPLPYVTNATLGLSPVSTEAQLKTFLTEWMKYIASHISSDWNTTFIGACAPDSACLVWYQANTFTLISGLPQYANGILVTRGDAGLPIWRFGVEGGTVYLRGVY